MLAFVVRRRAVSALVSLSVLATASPLAAQAPEAVGIRAQGMGSAFVAVADDATATYWNPAGLVNGPLVDVTLQGGAAQDFFRRPDQSTPTGASRHRSTFFALAFPALGVSYLRSVTENVTAPTGSHLDSRDIEGTGAAVSSRLVTDRFGVTLLQSLTSRLTIGTTVKVIRGSFAAADASVDPLTGGLDRAKRLTGKGSTKLDADVGLLASIGPVRAAVAARNLARPDFSRGTASGQGSVEPLGRLARQVRAGVALTPGFSTRAPVARPALTVSVDADLTRVRLPGGADERRVAAGIERWFAARRFAVRGGVQASSVGDRRVLGTAGASVAVRSSLLVDAYVARGRGASSGTGPTWAWGVAGHAAF